MRQKQWEQKHRLGSFRRRAKLPIPSEAESGSQASPSQQDENRLSQMITHQMPSTRYPQLPSASLALARRFSDIGPTLFSHFRQPILPPARGDRGLDRLSRLQRSESPIRLEYDGRHRHSPSRYDEDEPLLRNLSPVRYEDRSPSRSPRASDPDLPGVSPSHLMRREPPSRDQSLGMLSPKWSDGRSPRSTTVFFPDTDPFLYYREPPFPERLSTEVLPEELEGPAYMLDDEIPTREHDPDTDSTHSGEYKLETRL